MRSGRARYSHFPEFKLPGEASEELLHYINPNLKEQNFKEAIIYTGINDILYQSGSWKINSLLQNINEIGEKCKSYGIRYVFIASVTFSTRKHHKLLEKEKRNDKVGVLRK